MTAHKIEVVSKVEDMRANVLKQKIRAMGFSIDDLQLSDAFTLDNEVSTKELEQLASMLANPVTQEALVDEKAIPQGVRL